jgi:ketosteroid isomerase-like protein
MRKAIRFSVVVLSCGIASSCATPAQEGHAPAERDAEEIIALERSALDRYITADPQGYVDLYAQEVTYFDPTTEKRVDGLTAMQDRMAPMKNLKLPFTEPRYEMNNPKVVQQGDVALLTFNLVNYGKPIDRTAETVLSRWNSTEVYRRVAGKWRIIHSHWSFTKPDIKQPGT